MAISTYDNKYFELIELSGTKSAEIGLIFGFNFFDFRAFFFSFASLLCLFDEKFACLLRSFLYKKIKFFLQVHYCT